MTHPSRRRLPALLLAWLAIPAAAEESHPNVVNVPVSIEVDDGVRLAGVLTRPDGAVRPPVLLFVQWLSCDSVLLSAERRDGWSEMLRGVIRRSGYAVLRVDKRGVGTSGGGPCAGLDFDTELADHRAVLAALRDRDDVDTDRIVIFGASMGSRFAPLLAADASDIVGVLVWGGGALTWFERMLAFDRQTLELAGTGPVDLHGRMQALIRFNVRYLLDGHSPPDIIAADPSQAAVWANIVGSAPDSHYGRPFAFHHQAQRTDWAAAWQRVRAPALALQGELDWFESAAGGRTIERVTADGRFALIPGMDHHFNLFQNARQAFAGRGGTANPEPFLSVALPWLDGLVHAPR